MVDSVLEVKQIKQLSADGGGTVVDVENKTIDDVAIGGTTPAAGSFTSVDATGDVTIADKIVHSGDTNTAIRFPAADTVTVETDGTERMRIDSSGNVLVGGTSPVEAFAGVPTIQGVGNCIIINKRNTTGSASHIRFHNPNGTVGSIDTSGTTTSYGTSSDYRLKTDVQPMTGATERLKALNPVNFEWITDGTRVDGFLAHEAQKVVPEAVTGEKDAVDADGNPEYQGIDQSKLVPLLTAALQEAVSKIEALTARIEVLENAAG